MYLALWGFGCGAQALCCDMQASLAADHWGVWDLSSPTRGRGQSLVPCIARWIPNQWMTRKVPKKIFFILRNLLLVTIVFAPATKIFMKQKYDFFLDLATGSTQYPPFLGGRGLCLTACRILVLPPGIEPQIPAVKVPSPEHWTAREFPTHFNS